MTLNYLSLTSTVLLAIFTGACTGPGDDIAVQGVVRDSLTTQPVAALVLVGDDTTETGDDGRFTLSVSSGRHLVRVLTGDHEAFEREYTLDDDIELSLLLLRYGAYVEDVSIGSTGTVTATVKDPRDGSTIIQGQETWVIYNSPGVIQSSAIFSSEWDWERLDELSWRVTVQTNDPGVTGVTWLLSDNNLPALFDCIGPTSCSER